MYDPSTVELALETGLHPDDLSLGTSHSFADYSDVAFHQQNQYPTHDQYDGFQDDIGNYMLVFIVMYLNVNGTQKILLLLLRNVV